jgi:hypothetical protein
MSTTRKYFVEAETEEGTEDNEKNIFRAETTSDTSSSAIGEKKGMKS